MKIRIGFVSNSSTSSYLIIGIKTNLEDPRLAKLGFGEDDYLEYGSYVIDETVIIVGDEEPYYIAMSIEYFLLKDLKLCQINQIFIEHLKTKFGIDINPSNLELIYGEFGT